MPPSDIGATALSILTAAESLFAQYGYHGVSLRQITAEAKVNLAAINYHYYDKESLYRTVVLQGLTQINESRLKLLHRVEASSPAGLAPLPDMMHALAQPLFVPAEGNRAATGRLLGRLLLERHDFTEELLRKELQPTLARFGQAIRRHVPGLAPRDFLWRFSFIVGALHHSVATLHGMKSLTQGICTEHEAETALANFVEFSSSSMR